MDTTERSLLAIVLLPFGIATFLEGYDTAGWAGAVGGLVATFVAVGGES